MLSISVWGWPNSSFIQAALGVHAALQKHSESDALVLACLNVKSQAASLNSRQPCSQKSQCLGRIGEYSAVNCQAQSLSDQPPCTFGASSIFQETMHAQDVFH